MKILALDGALGGFSAALDDGARLHAAADRSARTRSSAASGGSRTCSPRRGWGCASWTGSRSASGPARSPACASPSPTRSRWRTAAGVPLVGVSSYDALEPDDPPLPLLTVVHGRRGVICARLRDAVGRADGLRPDGGRARPAAGRPAGRARMRAGIRRTCSREIAERGWTVRALPPRADVPAAAIAQLARTRDAEPVPARPRARLRRSPRRHAPGATMKAELYPRDAGAPQGDADRPDDAGDLPAVLRIEGLSFSTTWPPNAFANEIRDNKLAHYFVGRLDGADRRLRRDLGDPRRLARHDDRRPPATTAGSSSARRCCCSCSTRRSRKARRGSRSRCASRTTSRRSSTASTASPPSRRGAATTATTARTRW